MNHERQTENVQFPKIAEEIKRMCKADQDMRERWEDDPIIPDEDFYIDAQNTERMKEVVSEIGWPTISKVGKETSKDAWLLVQHADHDVVFQEFCLNLMKAEPDSEVEKINIAYLEDRVRLNKGEGQLYGTQFTQENNKHVPREIEDMENIDTRRAEIGMGPLSEQIQLMYDKYPFEKS